MRVSFIAVPLHGPGAVRTILRNYTMIVAFIGVVSTLLFLYGKALPGGARAVVSDEDSAQTLESLRRRVALCVEEEKRAHSIIELLSDSAESLQLPYVIEQSLGEILPPESWITFLRANGEEIEVRGVVRGQATIADVSERLESIESLAAYGLQIRDASSQNHGEINEFVIKATLRGRRLRSSSEGGREFLPSWLNVRPAFFKPLALLLYGNFMGLVVERFSRLWS
jgi:hypothetical protein